jgi:hypothetical protein
MLTVRDNEDDKVQALEAGADDYVTKPFQIRELTARVRSAIRRYRATETSLQTPLTIGDIMLDPVRRRMEHSGVEIHLTPHEFDALQILMLHAGRPVTHARLHASLHLQGSVTNRRHLRVLIGASYGRSWVTILQVLHMSLPTATSATAFASPSVRHEYRIKTSFHGGLRGSIPRGDKAAAEY